MKKKLTLHKETIRNLTATELKGVAGGGDQTDTTIQLCAISCDSCFCTSPFVCPTAITCQTPCPVTNYTCRC